MARGLVINTNNMSTILKNGYKIALTQADLKENTVIMEALSPDNVLLGIEKASVPKLREILDPFIPAIEAGIMGNCTMPETLQDAIDIHYANAKEIEDKIEAEVQRRLAERK